MGLKSAKSWANSVGPKSFKNGATFVGLKSTKYGANSLGLSLPKMRPTQCLYPYKQTCRLQYLERFLWPLRCNGIACSILTTILNRDYHRTKNWGQLWDIQNSINKYGNQSVDEAFKLQINHSINLQPIVP